MRIVQYEAGGGTGCGVQVADAVYATGHADTVALIRDRGDGLERAHEATERGEPIAVDRFLQPGDVVSVSATGIGELSNPVVQGTVRTR